MNELISIYVACLALTAADTVPMTREPTATISRMVIQLGTFQVMIPSMRVFLSFKFDTADIEVTR